MLEFMAAGPSESAGASTAVLSTLSPGRRHGQVRRMRRDNQEERNNIEMIAREQSRRNNETQQNDWDDISVDKEDFHLLTTIPEAEEELKNLDNFILDDYTTLSRVLKIVSFVFFLPEVIFDLLENWTH